MRKLYCGGRFAFDYLNPAYRDLAKEDYRAQLLGNENLLLEFNISLISLFVKSGFSFKKT